MAIGLQLAASLLLQAQTPSTVPAVRVGKVEISDIGLDSIRANVRLSAIARTSTDLRSLVFDEVTINGLRIRVPPAPGPIRLRTGQAIEGLPDLSAVLMYRELESLEPLRRAVRDGGAQVHAVVRAQVELNLFQKLALRTGGAWVTMTVDQQAPVGIPGGALGRLAALSALAAADPAWIANQSAREWLRNRTALAGKIRAALPGHLISLETRYELKSRSGQIATLRNWSSGFLIDDGYAVAPAEAVEPWDFDDSLAEALENGDVTLNELKTELIATLVSGSSISGGPVPERTFSLQRRELRIGRKPIGSESAFSSTTRRRYHVKFRNRDTNAVLLEIPALKKAGPGLEITAAVHDIEWQPAAVVRFDRRENENRPLLFLTEARWEDGRYRIKDFVDATAFGSPLWIDGAVAGLLQDKSTAADISDVLKRLR